MEIDARDLEVLRLVARFGQLSSKHVQELVFYSQASTTPLYRTLDRLVGGRYLASIERQRLVGGSRGGSGQHVYQLGLEGHRLFGEGKWQAARAINYHSLAIADCYLMLKRLERGGKLAVTRYLTEYKGDCHRTIGEYVLKPDLYAELARPGGGSVIRFMFEIDMGTQGQRQIGEKLARYWKASQLAGDAWEENLLVVFIAIHDERARELVWLLERETPEHRAMFRVRTLTGLEAELS